MFLLLKVLFGALFITKLFNCVFAEGLFELGIVPYYVAQEQYGEDVMQKVQDVIREIESQSCLKFVKLEEQNVAQQTPRVLLLTNEGGVRECVHIPKFFRSQVMLPLGYDCLGRGQILHTILHGIGMKDEVSNPGRDQYVRVMWANIAPEYRPLYQLASDYQPKTIEYDPRSVMQFHDRAYSVNGKPSLEPLISGLTIEQSENLSQLDMLRLHLLYNSECTKRDVQDLLQTCKNTLQNAPDSPDTYTNGGSLYDDTSDINPNDGVDYNQGQNPGGKNVDEDYTQGGNPVSVGVHNLNEDYTQGGETNFISNTQEGNFGDATVGGPSQNVDTDYMQAGNPNDVGEDYTQEGNTGNAVNSRRLKRHRYRRDDDLYVDVVVDDPTYDSVEDVIPMPDNPATTYTSNEADSE